MPLRTDKPHEFHVNKRRMYLEQNRRCWHCAAMMKYAEANVTRLSLGLGEKLLCVECNRRQNKGAL